MDSVASSSAAHDRGALAQAPSSRCGHGHGRRRRGNGGSTRCRHIADFFEDQVSASVKALTLVLGTHHDASWIRGIVASSSSRCTCRCSRFTPDPLAAAPLAVLLAACPVSAARRPARPVCDRQRDPPVEQLQHLGADELRRHPRSVPHAASSAPARQPRRSPCRFGSPASSFVTRARASRAPPPQQRLSEADHRLVLGSRALELAPRSRPARAAPLRPARTNPHSSSPLRRRWGVGPTRGSARAAASSNGFRWRSPTSRVRSVNSRIGRSCPPAVSLAPLDSARCDRAGACASLRTRGSSGPTPRGRARRCAPRAHGTTSRAPVEAT